MALSIAFVCCSELRMREPRPAEVITTDDITRSARSKTVPRVRFGDPLFAASVVANTIGIASAQVRAARHGRLRVDDRVLFRTGPLPFEHEDDRHVRLLEGK